MKRLNHFPAINIFSDAACHYTFIGLLFFFLCSTSSCTKEPEPTDKVKPGEKIEVSGKVVDATTGKPVPYAQIILTKNNSWTAVGAKVVEAKLTDSTGRFAFFLLPEEDFVYDFTINKLHYAKGYNSTVISTWKHNRDMQVKLMPYGYLNLHLTIPKEQLSAIHFNGSIKPAPVINPPFKDTSFIAFDNGNSMTLIWIRLFYKNGVYRDIRDSIFTSALDTVDYYVKY